MSGLRIMGLVFGVVCAGFGIMVMVATSEVSEEAQLLKTEGALAEATVTEKYTESSTTSSGIESSTDYTANQTTTVYYYLRYSFKLPDGTEQISNNYVEKEIWDRVREGDRYTVRYAASRPEVSTIVDGSYDKQEKIGRIAGSILIGAGAVLLFLALGWPALRRRLRRS